MSKPRRIGRPSRINEPIREARCPACRDWIPIASLRIHFEAAHPLAEPPPAGELREIPIAVRIAEYVAAGCPVDAATGHRVPVKIGCSSDPAPCPDPR